MKGKYILDDCFEYQLRSWLMNTNHPKAREYWKGVKGWNEGLNEMPSRKELLDDGHEEILQVLKKHPEADYFWYDANGKLTFTIPDDDVQAVPADSLKTDKAKIREALREIALSELLDD